MGNTARDPWLAEGPTTWARCAGRVTWTRSRDADPGAVRNRIGEPMSFWDRLPLATLRPGLYVQPVQALATLGESEAVDSALRTYVVRNAYRNVLPRDLLAALTGFFPDAEAKLRAWGACF